MRDPPRQKARKAMPARDFSPCGKKGAMRTMFVDGEEEPETELGVVDEESMASLKSLRLWLVELRVGSQREVDDVVR